MTAYDTAPTLDTWLASPRLNGAPYETIGHHTLDTPDETIVVSIARLPHAWGKDQHGYRAYVDLGGTVVTANAVTNNVPTLIATLETRDLPWLLAHMEG